jgi:hypothetical protein
MGRSVLRSFVGKIECPYHKTYAGNDDGVLQSCELVIGLNGSEEGGNKGGESAKYTIANVIRQRHRSIADAGGEEFYEEGSDGTIHHGDIEDHDEYQQYHFPVGLIAEFDRDFGIGVQGGAGRFFV